MSDNQAPREQIYYFSREHRKVLTLQVWKLAQKALESIEKRKFSKIQAKLSGFRRTNEWFRRGHQLNICATGNFISSLRMKDSSRVTRKLLAFQLRKLVWKIFESILEIKVFKPPGQISKLSAHKCMGFGAQHFRYKNWPD